MTLFIHIGMNKTGTTAVQGYAAAHRDALLGAGLLYPETGLGAGGEGQDHHFALATALMENGDRAASICRTLRAEIEGSAARHVLVSSEFLVELTDPSALSRHLDGMDIRIVVYLRRHDFWVDSLFNQAIKTDRDPSRAATIEAFIRDIRRHQAHWFCFATLLENWAGAFGRDAVIVRPYRSLERMDVIADLMALIGIEADALPPPKRRGGPVNGAVSRRQLAAIDSVQRSGMTRSSVERVARMILSKDEADAPRSLMPPAVAAGLICDNAADYAMIARDYLGRDDGVLFEEPLPRVFTVDGEDDLRLKPEDGMRIMAELLDEIGEALGV